jgi:ankyrin repeat protein
MAQARANKLFQIVADYDLSRGDKLRKVRQYIKRNPNVNPNMYSEMGFHMLGVAIQDKDAQLVQALVGAKADVNKASNDFPAIVMAAQMKDVASARVLLDAKADVNGRSNNNATAVTVSAQEGAVDVLQLVLEAKGDANAYNRNGSTGLSLAAQNGSLPACKVLLESKANPNHVLSMSGCNALQFAAQQGNDKILEVLIEFGGDCHVRDHHNDTALIVCAQQSTPNHVRCMQMLIAQGVDVNVHGKNEETALTYSAQNGCTENARLLINAKADLDATNNRNGGAFYRALSGGHGEIVKLLIDGGCAIDGITRKDKKGQLKESPLHEAMTHVDGWAYRAAGWLLARRANVTAAFPTGVSYQMMRAPLFRSESGISPQKGASHGGLEARSAAYVAQQKAKVFAVLCAGYAAPKEVSALKEYKSDVERYHRVHALVGDYRAVLFPVLTDEVEVDSRVGRGGGKGIYQEPLERVLEYCGLLLKPRVLSETVDEPGVTRSVMPFNLLCARVWSDRLLESECNACDKLVAEGERLKACPCAAVSYCGVDCQKAHWARVHKNNHKRYAAYQKKGRVWDPDTTQVMGPNAGQRKLQKMMANHNARGLNPDFPQGNNGGNSGGRGGGNSLSGLEALLSGQGIDMKNFNMQSLMSMLNQ